MAAPHVFARAGAGLRLLRAAVFTAVCVALSAAGHGLAADSVVPLWSLGLGFLLVLAVAVPLAGRERGLPGIAALLATGQVGLHVLFGASQQDMAMGQAPDSAAERAARLVCGAGASSLSPLEAHHILKTAGLDGSGAAPHPHAGMPLLPTAPMLLGHLLAALVAGWLLRRGDQALFRLVRLSAQAVTTVAAGARLRTLATTLLCVRAFLTALSETPQVPPGSADDDGVPPRTADLQHTVIRRGPPAAGFSLAA
ncbi:hypothetical protein AB0J21_30275 [Streptomyces sp. NPDC049954]|uniref:hypothetical protein n=1 Tax=Streptomyces sp. NPDC049954 TaxID=3155779 RepID=UPI003447AB9C